MTRTFTRPSREVLEHHDRLHAARCPGQHHYEVECPCAQALALVCGWCAEPVFIVLPPSGVACVHALELLLPVGGGHHG